MSFCLLEDDVQNSTLIFLCVSQHFKYLFPLSSPFLEGWGTKGFLLIKTSYKTKHPHDNMYEHRAHSNPVAHGKDLEHGFRRVNSPASPTCTDQRANFLPLISKKVFSVFYIPDEESN